MRLMQNWFGYLPFLLVLHWSLRVDCDNSTKLFDRQPNRSLIERQTHLITSGFSSILWNYIRDSLNTSTKIENVSNQCSSSLNQLLQSAFDGQVWALKFLSYSGSTPNDFLDGSYTTFGSYDSCLDVNQLIEFSNQSETTDRPSKQLIKGQYCLTSLEPDFLQIGQSEAQLMSNLYSHHFDASFNLTIKLGLCLPSTCSPNDVKQLTNQALYDYHWRLIVVNHCEVSQTFFQRYSSANNGQKIFFWLFMSLIGIVVWGTLLDIKSKPKSNQLDSQSKQLFWIQQFSAIKSLRSLFRKPDISDKIILLDQLRFTCVVIVISLHALMWFTVVGAPFIVESTRKGVDLYKRIEMQPLANDWITEGLIFVGGLSCATTLFKKVTPQTPISTYLRLIFRRAALLIPALLTVISMEVILPLFGSGPIFNASNQYRSAVCLKNFMYNIFHLQNFNEPLEICASHTWSIAVEWQLYIMLTVAVFIYKRNYRLGLAFNTFMIIFGLYLVNQVIIKYNVIPQILVTSAKYRDINTRMGVFYVSTETRIWIYFLGLFNLIVMLGNYESKLGIILTKLRYKIEIGLAIILSYTSIPWNVYNMPIEPITTIISSTIIKLLMGTWCSLIVLAHGKKFRKFLTNSKSNDIYIYNDEAENVQQSKVDGETLTNEKLQNNNDTNLNNNQESISTITKSKLSPAKFKSLHRFEIILRLYKATYFIHTITYAYYFTSLRQPINYSIRSYLITMFSLTVMALLSGVFFYILILGPVERIQYILSKKSPKPKTI